jgi:hypothetical protein
MPLEMARAVVKCAAERYAFADRLRQDSLVAAAYRYNDVAAEAQRSDGRRGPPRH